MTLTIFDVPQRSDEWYAVRLGIVTASAVGKLITVRKLGALDFDCPACKAPAESPCRSKVKRAGQVGAEIKTPHPERVAVAAKNKRTVIEPASNDESRSLTLALAAERIAGFADPTYTSIDMWRGVEDEPLAVDLYSEKFEPVISAGFMVEDRWGFKIGYSPDGLVRDDGLIEVKSRRGKSHVRTVIAGTVPAENIAQCQAALLVSGRQWIDYLSYSGGMAMYPIRVKPDPRWQEAIVNAVRMFEANVAEIVSKYADAVTGLPVAERVDHNRVELKLA